MLTIKPLDENLVYAYLCSFKDLDYSLNNAKQRLIDMFVNRVVLFDNECFIYFIISDDKGTQLKLSEQPDFEQETEFLAKKNNPNISVRIVIAWRSICNVKRIMKNLIFWQ